MSSNITALLADCAAVAAAAAALPGEPAAYCAATDDELTRLARSGADLVRAAARTNAVIAGELARRSARELGHAGLAQRQGFRTPVELVRVVTGSTNREASTAVRVGLLIGAGGTPNAPQPWLGAVAAAVSAGTLSVAAAESIESGIGSTSDEVSAEALRAAVAALVAEASGLDADQLFRRARELRDEIDENGVARREAALLDRRSLWYKKNSDGTARINWTLDPESAAICGELFDRATSPRRGGPRFTSGEGAALTERILADPRRLDQIASDTFVELLRHGAAADSSQLLGTGAPSVRVLVTERAFATGEGCGYIEGQSVPISMATVQRQACSGAVEQVSFDENLHPLDLGREERLYSRRQRRALAARDGGCRWPGCECAPSWTEAHHIEAWSAGNGRTDIANGILLCRFHHLLLHNNGWMITGEGSEFWLIPPRSIDPTQAPIVMPTKSLALKDALREREARAG